MNKIEAVSGFKTMFGLMLNKYQDSYSLTIYDGPYEATDPFGNSYQTIASGVSVDDNGSLQDVPSAVESILERTRTLINKALEGSDTKKLQFIIRQHPETNVLDGKTLLSIRISIVADLR